MDIEKALKLVNDRIDGLETAREHAKHYKEKDRIDALLHSNAQMLIYLESIQTGERVKWFLRAPTDILH